MESSPFMPNLKILDLGNNLITDINKITESIQKFNSKKSELKFISLKEDYIIKQIKEFGKLSNKLPCKLFNSKIEFNENLVEKWLNI